ncbi:hypothetical protein BpHYR1_039248 [Brachionus plicatilis]|uniref:Uncharacterized protein n=1 Tax=Brachionus plicatilis TaxID=10195 RepID=A0A3M7QUL4_BRAPC|nr:hypothetical protein BpHYR1_039248 [Brachionus plicatilis]
MNVDCRPCLCVIIGVDEDHVSFNTLKQSTVLRNGNSKLKSLQGICVRVGAVGVVSGCAGAGRLATSYAIYASLE